jgi:hypothetical protein
VPGKSVTDQQVRLYMTDRLHHSQRAAAARAGFSERTALRIPEYPPTHSDNTRPLVPEHPPTCDALP